MPDGPDPQGSPPDINGVPADEPTAVTPAPLPDPVTPSTEPTEPAPAITPPSVPDAYPSPPPGIYPAPGSYPPPGALPPFEPPDPSPPLGQYSPSAIPGYPPVPGAHPPGHGLPPPATRFGSTMQPDAAPPLGTGGMVASLGGQQNLLGILSALTGLLAICCCPGAALIGGGAYFGTVPLSIAALVLGYLHIHRVRRGHATNRNLALVGIVLGVIGLVIALCGGCTGTGSSLHNDVNFTNN